MNKITLVIVYLILSLFCNVRSLAQSSYGCYYIPIIVQGIKKHNSIYHSYEEIVKLKLGTEKEKVKLDSLIKRNKIDYSHFYDDVLFHMSKKVLLLDTFSFFNDECKILKDYGLKIVNSYDSFFAYWKLYKDIVILKSIRVFENNFILALQHLNSPIEVHFYFNLIGNCNPKLTTMRKEWQGIFKP